MSRAKTIVWKMFPNLKDNCSPPSPMKLAIDNALTDGTPINNKICSKTSQLIRSLPNQAAPNPEARILPAIYRTTRDLTK